MQVFSTGWSMFLASSLYQELSMRTTSASLPGEGKYIEILFSFQCEKKQFIFVSWVGGWGNIVYRKSKERAIERLSTYLGGQRIFCALKSFIEWLIFKFVWTDNCFLQTFCKYLHSCQAVHFLSVLIFVFRYLRCYSMVGRIGGQQKISIGRGCEYLHTVVHEIGKLLKKYFWIS